MSDSPDDTEKSGDLLSKRGWVILSIGVILFVIIISGVRRWKNKADTKTTQRTVEVQKPPVEEKTVLPPEKLKRLVEDQVKVLDLRDKQLVSLPESIESLLQLQRLDLTRNKLASIPETIGVLVQLQELYLGENQLMSLPEQIGSLTQLQKLYLGGNKLTSLPEGVGNLTQLQKLYLGGNKLTSLPERMGGLVKLQVLSLHGNLFTSLPERIGDLALLQELSLHVNQLKSLPEQIGNLTLLQELSLSWNQLTSLPERIGDLARLQKLYLYGNKLTSLPERIGDLVQLQELYVSSNNLTLLPERIGDLLQLRELGLYQNQLVELPERIGDLVQLRKLFLDGNQIVSLPERIGDLVRLRELYFRRNQLTSLPESIGSLVQLQELKIRANQLISLPESIGDLTQLKELDVSKNQLTSLPERIGDLVQLQRLSLCENQLRSLPRSVANLSCVVLLDVVDNPLVEYGEGDTLGWRELRDVFGDRVVLSHDRNISGSLEEIQKEDVYDWLAAMPLSWNIKRLRMVRLDPVPTHKLRGQEILDIWRNTLSKYEPDEGVSDGRDIESYIKTLYDIDPNAFKGWRMYPGSVANTKDLTEAIFVKMRDSINTDDGVGDALAYLYEIDEAMKYCPDRQMAAFNMVYSALYSKKDTTSFEYFIESEIASMKNYIFEMTVMPGMGTQNVHVLNHWKYELRDELGFDTKYQTRMGTFGQDIFGGHLGNVLKAFYSKFMPEYVVTNLVREINSRKNRICDSGLFLANEIGNDTEYRKRTFDLPNEEAAEHFMFTGIKKEGVEDILVKMGILRRNRDGTE